MNTTQTKMITQTYNGWANYETWNVALWIQNEYGFYSIALQCDDYQDFVDALEGCGFNSLKTPDGVKFTDSKLNLIELNELIKDL
jgi:hypothetical protein